MTKKKKPTKRQRPAALGKIEEECGYEVIKFQDLYRTPCLLRESNSIEDLQAVYIGAEDAMPVVPRNFAEKLKVENPEGRCWVPYPIPKEVQLRTWAHLTGDQVRALIAHLTIFLETGSFDLSKGKR